MKMLQTSIDSMTVFSDSIGKKYYQDAKITIYQKPPLSGKEDTLKIAKVLISDYNIDSLLNVMTLSQKSHVITSAATHTAILENDWKYKSYTIANNDKDIRRHKTEWYKKITLSLSCLIFFFIGAPLGAIIRKGGLGMPVVVSVLIFIFYYIIDNTGFKMARDGKWMAWVGMWTSTAILAPIGVFLTYKSNNDSVMLNTELYVSWIKRLVGIRSVRNLTRKEVIIADIDYQKEVNELKILSLACKEYIRIRHLTKIPNYIELWIDKQQDEEIMVINKQLENIVDELSNTVSLPLLNTINKYPIIQVNAYIRPFKNRQLNVMAGIILPIGLFFYIRIWLFRIRLYKDLECIIKINEDIQTIVQKINSQSI
jgi:lipopolysaccharide export system permease protein